MLDKSNIRDVAADVGLYLQAHAKLELFLDDLIGLAAGQFGGSKIAERYPESMPTKLDAVKRIASLADFDPATLPTKEGLNKACLLRNRLSHGKIISVRFIRDGYDLEIAKMGKPRGKKGQQNLQRESDKCSRLDLIYHGQELIDAGNRLEPLRQKVFHYGKGWPQYLVMPEDDPLCLDCFSELMSLP